MTISLLSCFCTVGKKNPFTIKKHISKYHMGQRRNLQNSKIFLINGKFKIQHTQIYGMRWEQCLMGNL